LIGKFENPLDHDEEEENDGRKEFLMKFGA